MVEIIKCPSQNDCYLPGLIITRVGVVTVLLILQLLISTSQEGRNCIMFIKISLFYIISKLDDVNLEKKLCSNQ
jgi:hypothetical protein